MGGGAVIRGMTRLIGAATGIGAATASKSRSVGFCLASSQDMLNASSSLNLDEKEITDSKSPSDFRHVNMEDWEYPLEEEWNGQSRNRLVFAPAPSEEEVEEATKELRAAIRLSIPASSLSIEDCPSELISNEEPKESVPETVYEDKVVQKSDSSLPLRLALLGGGGSSVYQAFHLLQTNPMVQDVVKSLARDPAVWRAVLQNEKVMELAQNLQDVDDVAAESTEKTQSKQINIMTITSKVCDFFTGKVLEMLDKFVEIVGSIFSSVERTFFSKEGSSTVDRTVASCMMLAVAVLLVVVVKRASI